MCSRQKVSYAPYKKCILYTPLLAFSGLRLTAGENATNGINLNDDHRTRLLTSMFS